MQTITCLYQSENRAFIRGNIIDRNHGHCVLFIISDVISGNPISHTFRMATPIGRLNELI